VCADDRWQKERRTFLLLRWIIGIILLVTTIPQPRLRATCALALRVQFADQT
jgi:hypothetical protein